MTLSSETVQKLSLQWQEELKTQKDRLGQAQSVVVDASQKIAMIEGGIKFATYLTTNAEEMPEE